MKKRSYILASLVFIFLFIGCDVKNAVDHPEMSQPDTERAVAPLEGQPFLQKTLSEEPPRTPVNLSTLVTELMNVTPVANQTDFDMDGLYDSVEAVIGTDPRNNDTDFDTLLDYFEALNGLDPLNPDSNDDGIADHIEINCTSLDLDGDNVLNAWDFDNDGDGVNDQPDLSPFAKSVIRDGFDISIQTTGDPTYIRFQVIPRNPDHLKLTFQTWDWEYDTEGLMQDLDYSREDIRIYPILELSFIGDEFFPNQTALNEVGARHVGDVLEVPLYPVLEFGSIVAFTGQLLYLNTTPLDVTLHAELNWEVIGQSDSRCQILNLHPPGGTSDDYIAIGNNMIAVGNVTAADATKLEWVKIGEAGSHDQVAIRFVNGLYLSYEDSNTFLFDSIDIGDDETFIWHASARRLVAPNGEYVTVSPEGALATHPSEYLSVTKHDRIATTPSSLVTYKEPFMFTGLSVEECSGALAGVFFSENVTEIAAAQLVMTSEFLYNSTINVDDIPGVLDHYNVNVTGLRTTVRDRYLAIETLSNVIIPSALAGLPENMNLPLSIAIEGYSKTADLYDVLGGSYVMLDSCSLDTASEPLVTTKVLNVNWYNTSTNVGLTPWGVTIEILGWAWPEEAKKNLIALMIGWDSGYTSITKIGAEELVFPPTDEALNTAQLVLELGLGGFDLAILAGKKIAGLRFLSVKNIMSDYYLAAKRSGWSISRVCYVLKAEWFNQMGKVANLINRISKTVKAAQASLKSLKYFKHFGKALIVLEIAIDIGMSIWAGVSIANAIGGERGRVIGLTYALVSTFIGVYMIGVIEFAMAFVPVLGWALLIVFIITDIKYGWTQKLAEYATLAFYGQPQLALQMAPYSVITEGPTPTFSDNNGLNAGDWIHLSVKVEGRVRAVDWKNDLWEVDEDHYLSLSWCKPLIIMTGPPRWRPWWGWSPDTASWIHALQLDWIPSAIYNAFQDPAYDMTWWREVSCEFELSASLRPTLAMSNYPVDVSICSLYKIWLVTQRRNFWYHVSKLFGGDPSPIEESEELINGTGYAHNTWLYFDVFPTTLNGFLDFSPMTLVDSDGDGLDAALEAAYGTSQWDYDTDGDQLNDKYEIDKGLDPTLADSDGDGVSDWYEHVYSTNATSADSDEDGLNDFRETSGWVIDFDYLGNVTLPFQIRVTSDPKYNDSDGDGIDDLQEYLGNTNPNSNDTNGDGYPDMPAYRMSATAAYEGSIDWIMPDYTAHHQQYVYDVCTDEDGYLYASGFLGLPNDNGTVRKYDPSFNIIEQPTGSYLVNLTCWSNSEMPVYIGIDDSNDWMYIHKAYSTTNALYRFNLDGSAINPDSWTPISTASGEQFVIGQNGDIYHLGYSTPIVKKYNSSGALLNSWGVVGPGTEEFDSPWGIAVDEMHGLIYVFDQEISYSKGFRLHVLDMSDGSHVNILEFGYSVYMQDLEVDDSGYLYAMSSDSTLGSHVRRYAPGGFEDVDFRFNGNGTHTLTGANRLCTSPDGSIYVIAFLSAGDPSTSRIWRFSQNFQYSSEVIPENDPDWDDDGLTNIQETDGWEITVDFASARTTFNVTSDPMVKDTDCDGLNDTLEFTLGSNPRSPDTDEDGVSDFEEWWLTTHPGEIYVPPIQSAFVVSSSIYSNHMQWTPAGPNLTMWDTDGDLLSDSIELTYGSSPVNPDSDADGLSDMTEFLLNSNPRSNDSDGDGALDGQEFDGNSSLLDPDSDGDLGLDGTEYHVGSNVSEGDSDGDNLLDGFELFLSLNPTLADSDGDGADDDVELSLFLDPLNNDTDFDGIPDGLELQYGSNPLSNDTDWDGIPDSIDPDTFTTWDGQVILVYGEDPTTHTLEFVQELSEHVDVTVVTLQEFLDGYTDHQYIVLVGRPDPSSYGLERLTYDMLDDTGSVLDDMMENNSHEVATRYGYWNDPQTVVIMSSAFSTDVYPVLTILRGWNLSILSDRTMIEFNSYAVVDNQTVAYAALVNEIDTVKATDASVIIVLSGRARPAIAISRYNETTTPNQLTHATGLAENDVSLGRYLDVGLTLYDTAFNVFDSAWIIIYYRESDIDLTGDSQLGDMGDINETSLCLYYYDTSAGEWIKLSEDLDWVVDLGQNTTNVELYGERYAGFVWARVTHLSLFAVAGQLIGIPVEPPNYLLYVLLFGAAGLAAVVAVARRRKGRTIGRKVKMDIVDQLLDSS
ncbi:MAG: hypothetical protein JSW61_08035 [Candidatus Thorarchaeota archaeon]|nr:MAG: hypothetical protein JSW61_08035 [Candidatus Thorarchaeota archaeon]